MIEQKIVKRRKSLIFALLSLAVSILLSTVAYYYLQNDKRILNIVTFPFHLLGAFSLIKIIESSVPFKFQKDSLWHHEEGEYVPFYIRARIFLIKPIGMLVLIDVLFAFFINWRTGVHSNPKYWVWIINNIIIIIFGFIIPAKITSKYILDLNKVMKNLSELFGNKNLFSEYEKSTKRRLFNKNEIFIILFLLILIRSTEIIRPIPTWQVWWGRIVFPLTPIWWSFGGEIFWMAVYIVLSSFSFTYLKLGLTIFDLSKNKNITINLFHPDEFAGLKEIFNYIFWVTSSILILLGFSSFLWYITIELTSVSSQMTNVITLIVLIIDIFALLIFLLPLLGIRNLIRIRKVIEKQKLLSRIERIEKDLMNDELKDIPFLRSTERMCYAIFLVDRIDAINEWLIGSKKKTELVAKILFSLNPIIIEYIIKYIIKISDVF